MGRWISAVVVGLLAVAVHGGICPTMTCSWGSSVSAVSPTMTTTVDGTVATFNLSTVSFAASVTIPANATTVKIEGCGSTTGFPVLISGNLSQGATLDVQPSCAKIFHVSASIRSSTVSFRQMHSGRVVWCNESSLRHSTLTHTGAGSSGTTTGLWLRGSVANTTVTVAGTMDCVDHSTATGSDAELRLVNSTVGHLKVGTLQRLDLTSSVIDAFGKSSTASVRDLEMQDCNVTGHFTMPTVTHTGTVADIRSLASVVIYADNAANVTLRDSMIQTRLTVLATGTTEGGTLDLDSTTFGWNSTAPTLADGEAVVTVTGQQGASVRFGHVRIHGSTISAASSANVGISIDTQGSPAAASTPAPTGHDSDSDSDIVDASSSSSSAAAGVGPVTAQWVISLNKITGLDRSAAVGIRIGRSGRFLGGEAFGALSVAVVENTVTLGESDSSGVVVAGSAAGDATVDLVAYKNAVAAGHTVVMLRARTVANATLFQNTLTHSSSTGAAMTVEASERMAFLGFSQNTVLSSTDASVIAIESAASANLIFRNNTFTVAASTTSAVSLLGGTVSFFENAAVATTNFTSSFALFKATFTPSATVRCNTQGGSAITSYTPFTPTVLACGTCADSECSYNGAVPAQCGGGDLCLCRCPDSANTSITAMVGPAQCAVTSAYTIPSAVCELPTATLSHTATPMPSLTNTMTRVPIPEGLPTLPMFYRQPNTVGLRLLVTRGGGVSSQRPLKMSIPASGAVAVDVVALDVAQTAPTFGGVSVNGAPFATELRGVQKTDTCGSLRTAVMLPNAETTASSLSAEASAAFEVSCSPSVFFSAVATLANSVDALRRGTHAHPIQVSSAAFTTIGSIVGSEAQSMAVSLRVASARSAVPATLVVPEGSSTAAVYLGPSDEAGRVTDSVRCAAGDFDSFTAVPHHIGAGPAIACRTPSGDPCRTVLEFHVACAADADCAGFTAAVTSPVAGATVNAAGSEALEFHEVPAVMHAVPSDVSSGTASSVKATQRSLTELYDRVVDTYPNAASIADTAFYRRVATAERTCSVGVRGHGRARVLLQQTSLASTVVDIFVKTSAGLSLRRGTCGGADLFAASQPGQSGACGLFLECTEVAVSPGDVVSIVPQAGINQFGCNESLGALLLFTEEAPAFTPSPGGPPPFPGHDVAGFTTRSFGARSTVIDNGGISQLHFTLLTAGARNSTVRVAQTRYNCGTPDRAETCPAATAVTLSTGPPGSTSGTRSTGEDGAVFACGGTEGFPQLGQYPKGYTGQCQARLDCSRSLLAPLPASTSNAGLWVQRTVVTVDLSVLRASPVAAIEGSPLCAGFMADLLVDASTNSASAHPLFPLWCPSTDAAASLCPALLLTSAEASGAQVEGATALANLTLSSLLSNSTEHNASSLATTQPLLLATLVDAQNRPQVASFVDWTSVRAAVNSNASLGATGRARELSRALEPRVALACLMDVAPSSGQVTCTVPIPANATTATVDVLQTDFAESTVELSFLTADGAMVGEAAHCGGAELFFGQRGRSSQCDTYLPCRQGFIPGAHLPVEDQGRPVSLRITVAENMASGPCEWALASIVTFKDPIPPQPCDAESEFTCATDASCVPRTAVCDGVPNDCGDNSDEAQCRFTLVDRDVSPNCAGDQSIGCDSAQPVQANSVLQRRAGPAITTYGDCLREAVVRGGRGFFLDDKLGCVVVNRSSTTAVIAEPGRWTTAQAADPSADEGRGELHVSTPLVTPLSRYQRCSAVLHCADRGVIVDQDTCACRCITSYTGPHCETLVQSGAIVTYIAVVNRSVAQSGNASAIPLNAIRGALAPASVFPAVRITSVEQPMAYDADHVGYPFVADSSNRAALAFYLSRIFKPATVDLMNGVLRPVTGSNQTIKLIFGVDAPNKLQNVGHCAVANGTVGGCPAPPFAQGTVVLTATGLQRLSISADASTTAPASARTAVSALVGSGGDASSSAETSSDGSTNSNATASGVSLECVGDAVSHGDASAITTCRPTTCVLRTGATAKVNVTRALEISQATVDPGCDAPTLALSTAPLITETPAVAPPHAEVSLSATQAFVFAGGGTGAAALFLIAVAAVAVVVFLRTLKQAAATLIGRRSHSAALGLAREKMSGFCGLESPIAAMVISFVIIAVVAGFFGVLYVHSKIWRSNTAVVLELFPTPECSGSLLKTLATTLVSIEATGRCHPLTVTGHSPGPLFGAAECVEVGGVKLPSLRLARSLDGCRSGDETLTRFDSDQCSNASVLLPELSFMMAVCVTETVAEERRQTLIRYNPVTPFSEQVAVTRDHMNTTKKVPAYLAAGDLFRATFQSGYTEAESSSKGWGTIAAVAGEQTYAGGFEAARLLVQDANAFAPATATVAVSETEKLFQPNLTRLGQSASVLAGLVPKDNDYPLGFVFSGFGSSAEISGDAAGLGAQRYRGVRATAFDIGHMFQPDPTEARLSITVSLWMRATKASQGFAFAVTDDYEDTHDRLSPVMTRLLKIASSGSGGGVEWFRDTWHAYSALYVDGPSQSLTFLFADPRADLEQGPELGLLDTTSSVDGGDVVRAQWSLPSMGEGNFFNGAWHKVTVSLRNDEGRFFAVIALDGKTSLSDSKWRKCLPRRPRPIVTALSVDASGSVNVSKANRASVANGGVAYVGHFNGGVRGLKVEKALGSAAADVRSGTRAMRVHAAVTHRLGIEAIAVILFFAAVLTFVYVVVQVATLVKSGREAARVTDERKEADFDEKATVLFTAAYAPVPFRVCMEWLEVTAQALVQIHGELEASAVSNDGNVKIVQALWQARHEQIAAEESTAAKDTAEVNAAEPEAKPAEDDDAATEATKYPTPLEWKAFIKAQGIAVAKDGSASQSRRRSNAAKYQLEAGKVAGETRATVGDYGRPAPTGTSAPNAPKPEGVDKAAGSVSANGGDQISTVVLAAVATLQGAAVYFGSFLGVPDVYAVSAGSLYGLITLGFDFVKGIVSHPLAGPIAQAIAAVLLLVAVACVMANDDRRFYGMALRYQVRRDTLQLLVEDNEEIAEITAEGQRMLAQIDPYFDPAQVTAPFTELHTVHVLPPEDRCAVSALLEENADEASKTKTATVSARDGTAVVSLVEQAALCGDTTELRSFPDGLGSPSDEKAAEDTDVPFTGVGASDKCPTAAGRRRSSMFGTAQQDDALAAQMTHVHFAPAPEEDRAANHKAGSAIHPGSLNLRFIGSRTVDEVRALGRDITVAESDYLEMATTEKSTVPLGEDGRRSEPVRDTGFTCVRHNRSWLLQTIYTDIFPFSRRRRCCAVVAGQPCGRDLGEMYCCPHEECGFALCAAHVRYDGAMGLFMHIWPQLAHFTGNGLSWVLEFIVLTLALALYTPVLRTCIMIVGCHPVYQCEFGDCWSYPTQRFAAAAYLAIVIIVLYGALFPLALVAMLHARFLTLRRVFARPSYGGRYLDPVPSGDTPSSNAELQRQSWVLWAAYAVERGTNVGALLWSHARSKIARRLKGDAAPQNNEPTDETTPRQQETSDRPNDRSDEERSLNILSAGPTSVDEVRDRFADRWLMAADIGDILSAAPSMVNSHPEAGDSPAGSNPSPPSSPWRQRLAARLSASTGRVPTFGLESSMNDPLERSGPRSPMWVPVQQDHEQGSTTAGSITASPSWTATVDPGQGSLSSSASPKSLRLRQLMGQSLRPASSSPLRPEDSHMSMAPPPQAAAQVVDRHDEVDDEEWQRFLIADQSVLAKLYVSVPVERLGAVVVLTVARFLLLVPPLLLEPSSSLQFLFIALGEVGFAAGFVLVEPFTSPWVTVTTMAGSAHQFVIVGLQALLTARAHDADLAPTVGALMLVATASYIAFIAAVLGSVLAYGFVAATIAESHSDGFFERFKISRPAVAPMYLCPCNGDGQGPVDSFVVVKEDPPDESESGEPEAPEAQAPSKPCEVDEGQSPVADAGQESIPFGQLEASGGPNPEAGSGEIEPLQEEEEDDDDFEFYGSLTSEQVEQRRRERAKKNARAQRSAEDRKRIIMALKAAHRAKNVPPAAAAARAADPSVPY